MNGNRSRHKTFKKELEMLERVQTRVAHSCAVGTVSRMPLHLGLGLTLVVHSKWKTKMHPFSHFLFFLAKVKNKMIIFIILPNNRKYIQYTVTTVNAAT